MRPGVLAGLPSLALLLSAEIRHEKEDQSQEKESRRGILRTKKPGTHVCILKNDEIRADSGGRIPRIVGFRVERRNSGRPAEDAESKQEENNTAA